MIRTTHPIPVPTAPATAVGRVSARGDSRTQTILKSK